MSAQKSNHSDPAIKTQRLTKRFGDLVAVNNLNLNVKVGEIFGLVGPNGAGKTTAIKMMLGILKPTSGRIFIFGREMQDANVLANIGYTPQETALYDELTVHENLEFFGKAYGLKKRELWEREERILEFVGLSRWKDTLVLNLSSGMKSRLSLACALIHQPRLLLLDEPTVGVDPRLRIAFWDYFRKLTDEGITILITTHYMDEANRCDRVGFMHNGKLIAVGTPKMLKSKTGTDSLEDAFLALLR